MINLLCANSKTARIVIPIFSLNVKPFHYGGRYHIETSPLICGTNQWTGFYMISASVMKVLNKFRFSHDLI